MQENLLTGPELRQRFQQKFEYSRVLLEFSEQQQTLIESGDYSELMNVLQQKQLLIEALQQVSQTDPPLAWQWKTRKEQLPPSLRQECEYWLLQSEQLLEQVMQQENNCTQQMQQQHQQTQQQLATASINLDVHDAYQDYTDQNSFDYNQ